MSRKNYNCKIVLLGEGCVGKTSLVLRFVEDSFSDKHVTTLQASFLNKKINLRGKRVHLSIWDTAGQERFHALGPIYYRDANGAVLVYDITDPDSFQKVKVWVKELRKMLGEEICLAIAGNKTDLESQRQMDVQVAEEYAKSVGAQHFHTSAKLNKGIEELFIDLSEKMIHCQDQQSKNRSRTAGGRNEEETAPYDTHRPSFRIADDSSQVNPQTQNRSKCCVGGGGDEVITGIPVNEET